MGTRIACQVLQRPDRVTFIWSQEDASFEPYYLIAAETQQFYRTADLAHQHLAGLLAGGDVKQALARTGHELYQLIFRSAAAADATPGKIQQWLAGLKNVASLEMLSDVPGRVPWNVVTAASQPDLQDFWGVRYAITAGRRVNPLKLNPILTQPDILLVIDPGLPLEERETWQLKDGAFTVRQAASRAELAAALRIGSPDLLCWVGPIEGSMLALGSEQVSLPELRGWIDQAPEGNPEPLFFLHAEGMRGPFLQQAALTFPGLITWEELPTARSATALGKAAFDRLLQGGAPLGRALCEWRQQQGWLGLALTAFCPAEVVLGEAGSETEESKPPTLYPLPDQPYRPLEYLDRDDRPLLAGRERDVFRFAARLDDPEKHLLLLHGSASCGKSSFLRAGVVPFLEDDSPGYIALRDRSEQEQAMPNEGDFPLLIVRASRDLAGQLAESLVAFCVQPYRFTNPLQEAQTVPLPELLWEAVHKKRTDFAACGLAPAATDAKPPAAVEPGTLELGPSSNPKPQGEVLRTLGVVEPVELWEALEKDAHLLGRVLDALTQGLPHDLVICIEQGEEIFTQAEDAADAQRRRHALKMLALAAEQAPRCQIILSLRTDFLGRLLGDLAEASTAPVGQYLLPDLDREQLLEVVLLPTSSDAIPFTDEVPLTRYMLTYKEEFANNLVDEVQKHAGEAGQNPVALLQVVCARLLVRARKRDLKLLDNIDLKVIGGVKDSVAGMVESRLKSMKLSWSARKALRQLLAKFCTRHADGAVTRDTFRLEEIERAWTGKKKEDALKAIDAAETVGLVETQDLLIAGQEGTYASLTQDSVARVAQDWNEHKKSEKFARTKVIDSWFIAVPLILLAAVVSNYYTRGSLRPALEKAESQRNRFAGEVEALLPPKYLGDLARAEQAWQTGDIVRMCKVLREQQVIDPKEDLRGFEWHYLWHLANSERFALNGHFFPVSAVAVSPDGLVAATAAGEGMRGDRLFLWDLTTGKKRATLDMDKVSIAALAFSSDGKYLVSAGDDKRLQVWDAQAGKDKYVYVEKPLRTLKGHEGAVLALACPEPVRAEKEVKKEPAAKAEQKPKSDKETRAVSLIASAGADKTIILWDLNRDDKTALLFTLKDKDKHTAPVQALAFGDKGKVLASADAAGTIFIWDVGDAASVAPKPPPARNFPKDAAITTFGGPVRALAFTPDGKHLAAGGAVPNADLGAGVTSGSIRMLDVTTGKAVWDAKAAGKNAHGFEVFALAISPDGKMLASSGKDNFVRLWELSSTGALKEIGLIKGHLGWIGSLAFAPAAALPSRDREGAAPDAMATPSRSRLGSYLVTGSYDHAAKVWHAAPTEGSYVLHAGASPMTFVAISPDEKLVAAAGKDGVVRVWSLANLKPVYTINEFKGPVTGLSFGKTPAKMNRLAVAAQASKDEGAIGVWDMSEDKDVFKAEKVLFESGKDKLASCLVITPDGKKLAGGFGKNVELWDIGKKEKPRILTGHEQPVRRLAVSSGGTLLAAAADDGKILVWYVSSGEKAPGSPLTEHKEPILSLLFVGDQLLSSSLDRKVRLWSPTKSSKVEIVPFVRMPVSALAFSREHGLVMKANWDHTISELFVAEPFLLKGHTGLIRAIAMTGTGQVLASASDDGSVRLWLAPSFKRRIVNKPDGEGD